MNTLFTRRTILATFGALPLISFLYGILSVSWLLAAFAILLFLAVTDFGRRCPLVLSIKHFYYRRKERTGNAEKEE